MTDNKFNPTFEIDNFTIGNSLEPYLIAEVSGNHDNDINRAKKLILAAKESGFDAVKIQYFTADDMTLDIKKGHFVVQSGLWQGRSLYDLYKQGATPVEWLKELFTYAKEQKITLFSSVFSQQGIDTLEQYGCPAYKIASFEAMDLELIYYAAKTKKPLIVSTGIIDAKGIDDVLTTCKKAVNPKLGIMHCISNYPAPYENFNLATVSDMQNRYSLPIGLSDHSIDHLCATIAVAKGASMVEKHITIERDDGAIDSSFSLPIDEMPAFVDILKNTFKAIGKVDYSNSSPRKNYRSLYAVKDIKKGQVITAAMIHSIRPGYGLPPKYKNDVLNSRAEQDISKGTPISWELLCKKT